MASVWTIGGKIVKSEAGLIYKCDNCPCGIIPDTLCNFCDETFSAWEITVAGVVDDICDNCNEDFNGTHILFNQNFCDGFGGAESACTWIKSLGTSSGSPTGCDGISRIIEMTVPVNTPDFRSEAKCSSWPGDNSVWLRFLVASTAGTPSLLWAYYAMPSASFDCAGENIFSFVCMDGGVSSNFCNGWPSTITAIPAECP